jgi:purine nucleoside phosphorylase
VLKHFLTTGMTVTPEIALAIQFGYKMALVDFVACPCEDPQVGAQDTQQEDPYGNPAAEGCYRAGESPN